MPRLSLQRTLRLEAASAPRRGAFVSAASGLVVAGGWLYVVADDELHIAVFPAAGSRAGALRRLVAGELPAGKAERKAQKADFEVLARLPAFRSCPHGALLAMGSGSRPNRRSAVLLPLDRAGAISGAARVVDWSGLQVVLARKLGAVNIEGAVVLGRHLCLLNRGHPRRGGSAVVRLDLAGVLRAMVGEGRLGALPCTVRRYDLGTVAGVPLGFTDGAALPDGRLVFSAVAESADDAYADGPCVASSVGVIGTRGNLVWQQRLRPPYKVEGIAVRPVRGRHELLLVTDADDARVPAKLYSVKLPDDASAAVSARKRPSRRSP